MTLLLFTDAFPYGKGEQFLETEIDYLASSFGRVLVLPRRSSGQARPVPHNVEIHALPQVSRLLSRQGLRALILSASDFGPDFFREIVRGLPKSLIPGWLSRATWWALRASLIARWLEEFLDKQDWLPERAIFYSYWADVSAVALALLKTRYADRIVLVSRAHRGDLFEEVKMPPYLPFRHLLMKKLDLISPVSEYGRRYLLSKYLGLGGRCIVHRLGVRPSGLLASSSRDGRFRIVSCSFVVPIKRVHLIAKAVTSLAAKHPSRHFRWDHLGSGPLLPEIESLAANTFPKNAEYRLHGHLPNSQVLEFYRTHPVDVFINVSSSEGVPVSIMEAQSYGIPIIATDVGGTREIVAEDAGFLISSETAETELVDRLERLILSPELMEHFRNGSWRAWAKFSNADVNYPEFIHLLKGLKTGEAEEMEGISGIL